MTKLLVISEEEVTRLLGLDALADSLRHAFRAVSAGTASVPPRMAAAAPDGILATMPGFVPDVGLGAKLVAYFRHNHARGLPGHQALVALFGAEDGQPHAIMGGTRITAIRTAMCAAVAAEVLARPASSSLAIVGAGVQGRSHLEAFTHLLRFADIRIASRDAGRAATLSGAHPAARAVASAEEAVRGADVVCLCTDADDPVVARSWLAPGVHVSSVGSGTEVDPETMASAAVFVESRAAVTQPFPAGARELAGWAPDALTEVGEVLSGHRPGRVSAEQVTVYKSTGHASEDVAAAATVYRAALDAQAGTLVEI
jgi:ornithine cyclodeaminase/alanine dehydrogenase-like protein (mu-crystallin family)